MLRGGLRFPGFALGAWAFFQACPPAAAQGTEPQPIRVELHWEDLSEPACLTPATLEAAVDALLSRPAFGKTPADAVIYGQLTRNADGTRTARIELRRPDGTSLGIRELRSAEPGCRSLRDGVPIALSLMIDTRRKEVLLQLPKPAPEPQPAPPAARGPKPTPPAPLPIPVPAPALAWRQRLSVSGAVERGLLPGTVFATRIGVDWLHASGWGALVQAGLAAPHTAGYEAGGVTAWAWELGAGGSLRVAEGHRLRADLAGLVETGEMLSRGSDFQIEETARSWMLEGLAGARGSVAIGGGWVAGLAGWCGVPIVRQRVTYRQLGQREVLTRSSPLFARAELFVGLTAW